MLSRVIICTLQRHLKPNLNRDCRLVKLVCDYLPQHQAYKGILFKQLQTSASNFKKKDKDKSFDKKKGKKNEIDQLLDEYSDDEETIVKASPPANLNLNSPVAKFMTSQAKKSTKKDKGSKVQKSTLSYQELAAYINPENYWMELEGILEDQRNHFVNHLTLRYYISKIFQKFHES